uniref:TSA: Wollemia nobilis Ref_Wollemi_Transcript_21724_826 transcribed RNA sequence n=1 Tax=Wollemia nobilis TaxID=56998 RepID=A0A0C9RR48_9CONI
MALASISSHSILHAKFSQPPSISCIQTTPLSSISSPSQHPSKFFKPNPKSLSFRPQVASSSSSTPTPSKRTTIPQPKNREKEEEEVFFDGGAHYGDLLANLIFGFSLLWMPLTVAAVFRALFLRYRFTNLRVTVISGLTGSDRRDFSYEVIKDVQVVPRLFGEWGDVIITLKDDTKVDLRSVPKFREIADYCLFQAGKEETKPLEATGPQGF